MGRRERKGGRERGTDYTYVSERIDYLFCFVYPCLNVHNKRSDNLNYNPAPISLFTKHRQWKPSPNKYTDCDKDATRRLITPSKRLIAKAPYKSS